MMSGKVGKFSKQNGICKRYFIIKRILYSKLQSYIAYAIDKQSGTCRRHLLLQGLYVPSVKPTRYVSSRFNTSFCTTDHKTHLAISCYTLLHQATRGEGKNSLREHKDILVSDCGPLEFFFLIQP